MSSRKCRVPSSCSSLTWRCGCLPVQCFIAMPSWIAVACRIGLSLPVLRRIMLLLRLRLGVSAQGSRRISIPMANIDVVQWIAFIVLSLLVLGGGLMVVADRNLFHSALWLLVCLFGVAGFFVMLSAPFLAAVQV